MPPVAATTPNLKFSVALIREHTELANRSIQEKEGIKRSTWDFAIPMLSLVVFTWYFDVDFLKGIYVTLFIFVAMILLRRRLSTSPRPRNRL